MAEPDKLAEPLAFDSGAQEPSEASRRVRLNRGTLQVGSLAIASLALVASATSSWTTVMSFRRAQAQALEDAARREADSARLAEEQRRTAQERRLAKRQELRQLLQRLSSIPRELALQQFDINSRASTPLMAAQAAYAAGGAHNTENTFLAKQAYDLIKSIQEDVSASECLIAAMALWNSWLFDPQAEMLAIAVSKAEQAKDAVDLVVGLRSQAGLKMQMGDAAAARRDFGDALGVFARPGFASANKYFVEYTHYGTYLAWAGAELSQRNCVEARAHWRKAVELWQGALDQGGSTMQPMHAAMEPAVDLCRQAPSAWTG
jgi:hypothetical protein